MQLPDIADIKERNRPRAGEHRAAIGPLKPAPFTGARTGNAAPLSEMQDPGTPENAYGARRNPVRERGAPLAMTVAGSTLRPGPVTGGVCLREPGGKRKSTRDQSPLAQQFLLVPGDIPKDPGHSADCLHEIDVVKIDLLFPPPFFR